MLYARPFHQLAIAYGLLAALGATIIPALFFILLMIWDLQLIKGARWLAVESIPMFPGMVLRAILPGILALLWCRFRAKFRKPPDNPDFRLNRLYMRPRARPVPLALAGGDALGRILPPYRVYLGMSLLTAMMLSTGTQMIDALKPAGGYVVTHIYTVAPTELMFDFDVALGALCAAFPGTVIAIWRTMGWRSLEPGDPQRYRIAFRRLAFAYGMLSILGVTILGLSVAALVIARPTATGGVAFDVADSLGLAMMWVRMSPPAFLFVALWVLLWSVAHPALSAALLIKWCNRRSGWRGHFHRDWSRMAGGVGLKSRVGEVMEDVWAYLLPPYRVYLAMCAVTAVVLPAVFAVTQGYIASAAFYHSMWVRLTFSAPASTDYLIDMIAAFLASAFPGTVIALWRVATRPRLMQKRA